MKKLLALLLSAALLCSAALPALAEAESADARLTQVTQRVKETLDLDTTAYTEFYGDHTEDALTPLWYLTWTGDIGSLSVEALEDGTVVEGPTETQVHIQDLTPQDAVAAAALFLVFNIPTAVLLGIWFYHRSRRALREELRKMTVQDLE